MKTVCLRSSPPNGRILLSDGRRLSFQESGSADGHPVLYFHGFPGSRLEAGFADPAAKRHSLRIIGVDRPGFGLSDFQPGRRLIDWPHDVTQLADALNIKRFAVLGVSGGGPYAAVCAFKIPSRLTVAGIGGRIGSDRCSKIHGSNDAGQSIRLISFSKGSRAVTRDFSDGWVRPSLVPRSNFGLHGDRGRKTRSDRADESPDPSADV